MDLFHGPIQFFQENKNHKQKPVFESDFPVYTVEWIQSQNRKNLYSVDRVFYSFSWIETPEANERMTSFGSLSILLPTAMSLPIPGVSP
jgi:hypothetical protein